MSSTVTRLGYRHRLVLRLLVLATVAAGAGAAESIGFDAGAGLTASYEEADGTLRFLRCDTHIDFDWGEASPDRTAMGPQVPITNGPLETIDQNPGADIPEDDWVRFWSGPSRSSLSATGFVVRWYGLVRAPGADRYRFRLVADPDAGLRLWVGGDLVVDAWDGGGTSTTTAHAIPAEGIPIRVEYRKLGARARIALEWARPGEAFAVVPATALRRTDGAAITEGAFSAADDIHVAAGAEAGGDGSAEAPFASLNAGARAALRRLDDGQNARLRIAPGRYRDDFPWMWTGTAALDAQTALAIVGDGPPGSVVISGLDDVSDGWQHLGAGLWRRSWPHDLVFKGSVRDGIGAHREVILITLDDGRRLRLRPVELELFRHRGGYEYDGYRDPRSALGPGAFGVTMLGNDSEGTPETIHGITYDPASSHDGRAGDANSLFLRLPDQVEMGEVVRIEAAVRDRLLWVDKSNLLLRNLVFEGAASYPTNNGSYISSALHIGDAYEQRNDYLIENVLLEDVEVRHCAGGGLRVSAIASEGTFGAPLAQSIFSTNVPDVRRITLRRVTVHDNGTAGVGGPFFDALWEDCRVVDNGWRSRLAGTDSSGVGYAAQRFTVRGCTITGNAGNGMDNDHFGEHISISDTLVANNDGFGMQFEVGFGPQTLERVRLVGNAENGLMSLNNDRLTLRDCLIMDNAWDLPAGEDGRRRSQIMLGSGRRVDRELAGDLAGGSRLMAISSTWIASSLPQVPRLFTWDRGGPPGAYQTLVVDSYTGERNRFGHAAHPDGGPVFTLDGRYHGGDRLGDLAAWVEHTGSEQRARWLTPPVWAQRRADGTAEGWSDEAILAGAVDRTDIDAGNVVRFTAGTGSWTRSFDASGAAAPVLRLTWRGSDWQPQDTVAIEVQDGDAWLRVATIPPGAVDGSWRTHLHALPVGDGGLLRVRLRGELSPTAEFEVLELAIVDAPSVRVNLRTIRFRIDGTEVQSDRRSILHDRDGDHERFRFLGRRPVAFAFASAAAG